jgi:hypothetical protein
MKANNNRKRNALVAAFGVLTGMSVIGSVAGTVAWYQYSTRSTANYVGTSTACTEKLQMTLGTVDANSTWKSDFSSKDVLNYLKNTAGYGEKAGLVSPVTNPGLGKNDKLGDFYGQPVYQYNTLADWQKADSKDYITLPMSFRVLKDGSETETLDEAKNLYVQDVTIKDHDADSHISDAIRVHFSSGDGDAQVNRLVSKKGNSINTYGELDLNGDGTPDYAKYVYDFDSEDAKTPITYGEKDSVQESYTPDSLAGKDDRGTITGDTYIATIPASGTVTVNVTIWLEGWQELEVTDSSGNTENKSIWDKTLVGNQFDVGMTFAVSVR